MTNSISQYAVKESISRIRRIMAVLITMINEEDLN